ncbi:MAG: hypothetical protein IPI32_00955 [Austwickia sp.]|jgi:uncharacterized protein|nr:hypothetical protein [Austwickia sp.]MBK8437529.1 hypothetical protein [Austwickia sp.]MBK9102795.1 hypothetical protein [Austwickia sp.]
MPFYAVQYTYTDDAQALEAGRPAHRDYIRSFVEPGLLRASGPYPGADPDSALLIFKADSEKIVQDIIENDPFTRDHLIARHSIHEWRPLIGVFADELDD